MDIIDELFATYLKQRKNEKIRNHFFLQNIHNIHNFDEKLLTMKPDEFNERTKLNIKTRRTYIIPHYIKRSYFRNIQQNPRRCPVYKTEIVKCKLQESSSNNYLLVAMPASISLYSLNIPGSRRFHFSLFLPSSFPTPRVVVVCCLENY